MWILGHRGASHDAPENTLNAFRLAFAQGADGIEFDTYELAEDIIVFHDKTLTRTTNGKGNVLDHSLAQLRQLDAGEQQQIPLLNEVLGCCENTVLCNIEIKQLASVESWLGKLDSALQLSQVTPNQLLISSFTHSWLHQIAQRRPDLHVGALTAISAEKGLKAAMAMNAYSVHFALDVVDERYVRQAHQAGLKVLVYTVDLPADMQRLAAMGVDGIFTNVPAIARQTLSDTSCP